MTRPGMPICTVGTSFFRPNLKALKKELAEGKIPDELNPLAQA